MKKYPAKCGNPTFPDGTCCCPYCEGFDDGLDVATDRYRPLLEDTRKKLAATEAERKQWADEARRLRREAEGRL